MHNYFYNTSEKVYKKGAILKQHMCHAVTLYIFLLMYSVVLGLSMCFCVVSAQASVGIWINSGEDKVTKDELRLHNGVNVNNEVWDGKKVTIFGAKNETVSFNIILESAVNTAENVRVQVSTLKSRGGCEIKNRAVQSDGVFDYIGRDIEVFYVRYLQIKGLSRLAYVPTYDERHIPERLQLPYSLPKGTSSGVFTDRPGANKWYPDIAVPIECVPHFSIPKGENQSIWVDIYIPRGSEHGTYAGTVDVIESNVITHSIPIELVVYPFQLPDVFSAKTMVWISEGDINNRYTGVRYDDAGSATPSVRDKMERVWMKHHIVARRHRISLINDGLDLYVPRRLARWDPVFSGKLFKSENGYSGPGEGVPGDVYSIGTYGGWRDRRDWGDKGESVMHQQADRWVGYFQEKYPAVEYFLYLSDEPRTNSYNDVERWAVQVKTNPGIGKSLKTLCTTSIVNQQKFMQSLDIAFVGWGDAPSWESAIKNYNKSNKKVMAYNGWRPSSGTMMIEDDGVALRVNGWIQFKHNIDRWFIWASTNYKNPSRVNVETNVFKTAMTFGRIHDKIHPKYGETGNEYGNGDGLLFYPGTDLTYPEDSYGLEGPIVSLRLKHWRRGLQDFEYLVLASKTHAAYVDELVLKMVPKSLWELGVSNPLDPTYVHTGVSWSVNPDDWERARRKLSEMIIH